MGTHGQSLRISTYYSFYEARLKAFVHDNYNEKHLNNNCNMCPCSHCCQHTTRL